MPGPELPETPAPLKSIQPYLKTANEHDARDVVVSYWCRLYALQTGLKLSTKTSEETNFLLKLMDWLESTKKANHENEAITNEVAAQAHLENWALKLFLYADKNDRASNFGKNVVQSFYTAGLLYDVLTTFGELSEEASQNRKYAKWKAAYIHNCLKNGQTPVPGPAKEDDDDNSNENIGSNLLDYDDNADHENNESYDPGMQPSQPILPSMPMQPPLIPMLPTQPTPPTTMGAYDFPSVPAKDKDNEDDENNEGDGNNEGVENNDEPAENDENKDDENNENLENDENNENDESTENKENVENYESNDNDENTETNENDENNQSNENDESNENVENTNEAAENEENQDDEKNKKSEPHPYNPAPTPTNPGTNNRVSYDGKSSILKSEAGVELTVEQSGKAQKYIKWAGSALNYDDVPTAILNLRKALHLLTTGEDPA